MLWRLVDVSPSSMLSSSDLLFLVSGSIKTVTKMPSTLTAAAINLAARRPPALNRIGNKNTPMKPPELAGRWRFHGRWYILPQERVRLDKQMSSCSDRIL